MLKIRLRRKEEMTHGIEESGTCGQTTEEGTGDWIRGRKREKKDVSTLVRMQSHTKNPDQLVHPPQ